MKRLIIASVIFCLSAINTFADNTPKTCSIKNDGTTIGYVTAWIENGNIHISSDAPQKTVTVTVTYKKSGDIHNYTATRQIVRGKTEIIDITEDVKSIEGVSNPICN
ncbi:MAG: hypothetical protein IJB46_08160 [Prevotella sp.]|nr:hypothetical protein [Prevotella sp.]